MHPGLAMNHLDELVSTLRYISNLARLLARLEAPIWGG